ncbi:DUF4865 family protein [Streptomyces sp. NPDC002536]
MYAQQYEITLPADYDMGTIRTRVAKAAHILDDRAGLGLKAYAIRERGVDGSQVNQYAPMYLWHDTGRMSEFLVGRGGFQNIIGSFGRPPVHHWAGIACEAGPARAAAPKAASRRLTPMPDDADPAAVVDTALGELAGLARTDGVHTAALAFDPRHWQLLLFVLWEQAVAPDHHATERYEVLHLSTPHLDEIPRGRHW